MPTKTDLIPSVSIEKKILLLRSQKVLLDSDLAELEKKYDAQFKIVFDAIRELVRPLETPRKPIGFHMKD